MGERHRVAEVELLGGGFDQSGRFGLGTGLEVHAEALQHRLQPLDQLRILAAEQPADFGVHACGGVGHGGMEFLAARNNLVRNKAFAQRIRELMNRYTNQQLTSAEVISALIKLAREAAAERDRGKNFTPALDDDELAFYDAVHENESAVVEMGDDILGQIARELVQVMRRDIKTDWTVRDDVRAKLRSSIKRLLIKNKYPPDKQPAAIRQVIDQMEALAPKYAEQRRAGAA